MTDQMEIDQLAIQTPQTTSTSQQQQQQQQPTPPLQKPRTKTPTPSSTSTRELTTTTIKSPPFAYVHLSTPHPSAATVSNEIDSLQVRSYCTTALRQFLGETGASILPDILLVNNNNQKSRVDVFLRLPWEDLAAFAGAITAFGGDETSSLLLQVVACGDWLGSLIGKGEEGAVWGGSS